MYGFTVRPASTAFFANSPVKGKHRRGVGGCLLEAHGQFGKEPDSLHGGTVCYLCCLPEIKNSLAPSHLCICSKFEISPGNGERDVHFFFLEINLKLFRNIFQNEFLIFGGKAIFLITFSLDENYNWKGPF